MLGHLTFKLRVSLAKQVSQDFLYSFLGLISPLPLLGTGLSGTGLNQAGDVGSQEIRRPFTDRMRTQAMTKPRGEGPSPLFYSSLSPSLMAPLGPCLSSVVPPLRNLTHHWLTNHLPGVKQGEVKGAEVAPLPGG